MYKTIVLLTVLFLVITSSVLARSGCCSHHGGVCGCGCCDGTGLSATCLPYYPQCSGGLQPQEQIYYDPTSTPRPLPTWTPIPTATRAPTPSKIPTPTKRLTPTIKKSPTATQKALVSPTTKLTATPTVTAIDFIDEETESKGNFLSWLFSLFK